MEVLFFLAQVTLQMWQTTLSAQDAIVLFSSEHQPYVSLIHWQLVDMLVLWLQRVKFSSYVRWKFIHEVTQHTGNTFFKINLHVTQHSQAEWYTCSQEMLTALLAPRLWLHFDIQEIFGFLVWESTDLETFFIYQKRETVFYWDIQTPRRKIENTMCSGAFLTKLEVFG